MKKVVQRWGFLKAYRVIRNIFLQPQPRKNSLMIEFAPFFMRTQFLSKISLLIGRSSLLLTDFSTLIPACPPSLSPDSWSPACTYSPRRTTRATHTRSRSSEISHGSHGGHVCVCCSCCCCFFWGTTGEGVHQTQQHSQIYSTAHIPMVYNSRKNCSKKCNFSSDVRLHSLREEQVSAAGQVSGAG